MKLSVIKKGFSLIEVVVALFILSISVITIYNLIISTSVSSYDLEQRYLAKEVANNHIALLNTIEKPLRSGNRKGEMIMGGQNWVWDEEIYDTSNEDYFEYEVRIKLAGQDKYIYSTKGYLIK
jgi:type II secretion system protein I|tara:strand:- start:1539 stop:1907 length:369 start_codon:yes stop_codon:yes gene_type:complete